jgi:Protein of unknown function (DUF3047)
MRQLRDIKVMLLALFGFGLLLPGASAIAEDLVFGPDFQRAGWTPVSFRGIRPASFTVVGEGGMEVTADAAAGLLWRALGSASRHGRVARWHWRVDEGVPPTDLTKRGVDDRALGVYFIFGERTDTAQGPLAMLSSPSVSALVYVFGGDRPRGEIVSSPHMGARGKFVVLRPADTRKGEWFEERVDIGKDYARAFGRPPPLLLNVAISSDSDDTGMRNRARIEALAIDN